MNDFIGLLTSHFDVQKGMYFSNCIEKDGYLYFLSDIITDGYWNYAYRLDGTNVTESSIDQVFFEHNRPSSIYVINSDENLLASGFELLSEESFMVYKGGEVKLNDRFTVKRASKGKLMDDFIDVFISAYGGEKSPEQPYGELDSTYMDALIQSFDNEEQFHHFVCYKGNEAVSVASLCKKGEKGGLYNVGTSPAGRGHGCGTAVTLACIKDWHESGGKKLFLQTEAGSLVEKWYQKLGFETAFIGRIYSKE